MESMHKWDIILLESWSGYKAFQKISVAEGVYKTLINLGKGVSVEYFNDEEENREVNLLLQIRKLDEDNKSMLEAYEQYFKENIDLEDDVEYLIEEIKKYCTDEQFEDIVSNLNAELEYEEQEEN